MTPYVGLLLVRLEGDQLVGQSVCYISMHLSKHSTNKIIHIRKPTNLFFPLVAGGWGEELV